jgi:hypothetical protein
MSVQITVVFAKTQNYQITSRTLHHANYTVSWARVFPVGAGISGTTAVPFLLVSGGVD